MEIPNLVEMVVIRLKLLSRSFWTGKFDSYLTCDIWVYLFTKFECWIWRVLCYLLCSNLVHNYVCFLLSAYDVVSRVTTRLQPGFQQKWFLLLNRFFMTRYLFKTDWSHVLWDTCDIVYLSQVIEVVKESENGLKVRHLSFPIYKELIIEVLGRRRFASMECWDRREFD